MNQALIGCGIVALVLLGLAGVVFLSKWAVEAHDRRNRRRAESLSSLAARWNGELRTGYFAADHRLSLNVDGIPGEVTFKGGENDEKAWTRLQFNCPTPRRLRVAPEGFSKQLSRLFGGGDLTLGDTPFDEAFWVESSDEAWAREVLDASLRARLRRLRENYYGFGGGGLTLDVGPAGVCLRLPAILLDDPPALGSLIELGVEALHRVRGGAAAGVEFAAVEIRGGSVCPVCGHAVDGGRMCPACRTPHHEDCWKYWGGCAVFACEGRPQKAA